MTPIGFNPRLYIELKVYKSTHKVQNWNLRQQESAAFLINLTLTQPKWTETLLHFVVDSRSTKILYIPSETNFTSVRIRESWGREGAEGLLVSSPIAVNSISATHSSTPHIPTQFPCWQGIRYELLGSDWKREWAKLQIKNHWGQPTYFLPQKTLLSY